MESVKVYLQLLYWLVLIAACALIFNESYFISSILRDALMPVLIAYLMVSLKPTHSARLKIFFFLSLVFLWASDILNGFINPDYYDPNVKDPYLYGSLACYGVANIFYLLSYYRIRKVSPNKAVVASVTLLLGIILTYFLFFKFISAGIIKGNKPPFILFMATLILVASFAANITDSNSKKKLSFSYFLPAAIVSVFATVLYVFNKYGIREHRIEAVVLLMYGYAQMLNINGFRKTSK